MIELAILSIKALVGQIKVTAVIWYLGRLKRLVREISTKGFATEASIEEATVIFAGVNLGSSAKRLQRP